MANNDKKYFTTLVDGQLSVRTVAQTGDIIPEENKPASKYTTALVQTSDGPQLCVKTYDLNGGGGGGTVDQTYDPTSENAQSGTAVAEAVAPALKNTATGTKSLTILGTAATGTNQINIGANNKINWGSSTIIVGTDINSSGHNEILIGNGAKSCGGASVVIGNDLDGSSWTTYTTCIGYMCKSSGSGSNRVMLGSYSETGSGNTIAIGCNYNLPAKSMASNAIQLGGGTNSTANTFQVYSYPMLDGTTGKIPMARLPIVQISQADYDALVSGGTVDANTLYLIV